MVQSQHLNLIIKFMLARMLDEHYNKTHPASWGYILRELRKEGFDVEDEALLSFKEYKEEAFKELRDYFCPRCIWEGDPEMPQCKDAIAMDPKYTAATCNQYRLKRKEGNVKSAFLHR